MSNEITKDLLEKTIFDKINNNSLSNQENIECLSVLEQTKNILTSFLKSFGEFNNSDLRWKSIRFIKIKKAINKIWKKLFNRRLFWVGFEIPPETVLKVTTIGKAISTRGILYKEWPLKKFR